MNGGRKETAECIILQDGGIPLCAVLERPGSEKSPLVIHLHGFSSTKDRPHNIAACEAMREAGCATLRVDLFGHGESGGEFRKHTVAKWVSNTLAVMDYAGQLPFVTGLYLSGHSQGGLTAALAAGMEGDRVKGLILRAPAFRIPEWARSGRILGYSFDPDRIPDEIRAADGLTLEGDYIRSAQEIRVEEAIGHFSGKVLILHGDQDDTVPLQDAVWAAKRYKNCQLEFMQGETHHFDRHPETMKALIRAWLQKEAKGTESCAI